MRQQDGAAAVEFALVALPFLTLLFAILETALVFLPGKRWRPPSPKPVG